MRRLLFWLFVFLWTSSAWALALEYQPEKPFPGAPVLLTLPEGVSSVTFFGHRYEPFSFKGKKLVLLAVPLSSKPGTYPLVLSNGQRFSLRIYPKKYPEEHLTVPPKMVRYPPKVLARIKREIRLIRGTVARFHPEALLDGPFVWPAPGRLSSAFGFRRVYNGEPRSPHGGVDIACPAGTPVKAANRGRVALVGDFYLPGKTVVLDHGLGIYTVYCHLSKILVREGEILEKGEIFALSGKSGRVTGPHLHFGCYILGSKVDPQVLLEVF